MLKDLFKRFRISVKIWLWCWKKTDLVKIIHIVRLVFVEKPLDKEEKREERRGRRKNAKTPMSKDEKG